jgi:hypothetical protein
MPSEHLSWVTVRKVFGSSDFGYSIQVADCLPGKDSVMLLGLFGHDPVDLVPTRRGNRLTETTEGSIPRSPEV